MLSVSLTLDDDREALLEVLGEALLPDVRGRFFIGNTGPTCLLDDAQDVSLGSCFKKSSPLRNSSAASSARAERGQDILINIVEIMQSSSPSAAAERREEAHHKRRATPLAINVYASLLDTCAYLRQRESQATISQTHTKKVDNGA